MTRIPSWLGPAALASTMLVALSCSSTEPDVANPTTEFSVGDVDLQALRDTVIQFRNTGASAVGPISLVSLEVRNSAGSMVPGPSLTVTPSEIATLNPGASVVVTLRVDAPGSTPTDDYEVGLEARTPATMLASLRVRFSVQNGSTPAAGLVTISGPTDIRQGDVVPYSAEVRDSSGTVIPGAAVQWSVLGFGLFAADGRFVAYGTGSLSIVAQAGPSADTLALNVQDRGLSGTLSAVGSAPVTARYTSDLWVHGSTLYSGTWGSRTVGQTTNLGNTLFAWDLAAPVQPTLTDSVRVDARVVNDVKIRGDGALAVITHEGSNDGQNGITLLDMSDRAHPTVITRFTNTLTSGVHNAWIDGNYVYLVVDGTGSSAGLRVLDISNPANPTVVSSFYAAGSSFLHDVYVRDGLAFLSHWDAGLVILDVGNGIAGGSPQAPVEVSRVLTQGGQTHNAWYWPSGGYVFVGEEDFSTPGIMHVIDVSSLQQPREVASLRVQGATPHNFWMDETNAVLYLSWYENGLRVVDVSGELMGELERQGREIASLVYGSGGTMNWAPQLHNGLLYLSDLVSGLWVLQLN